jgi:hypothetical protein
MTSDSVRRGMRVLTLPSVLFTSGLAGHALAGGDTPSASVLVPLFLIIVLAVAPFAEGASSPARSVVLLAGGQGLLHAALQLFGGTVVASTTMHGPAASAATGSPAAGSHSMMHHGAGASHDPVMSLTSDGHLVMLLAHLAAGVVVGLWLAAGERAFLTLLALTVRPLVNAWRTVAWVARSGVTAVVVTSSRPQIGWSLRCVVRRSMWTAGVVSRRGPPAAASREPYAYAALLAV